MRIRPFRGYRYGGGQTRDVTKVVAPPYDQIGPESQARLYAMSPHNVVRITLPREAPGRDRYAEAARTLREWLADGVFSADDRPAIYPYQQTYTHEGATVTRTGFVALGEVTDYARRIVLPHERTHAGPKRDRLALLEATGADVGLLFMLVRDPDGALSGLTAPAGEPVAEALDFRGESHRLWRLTDAPVIAEVQALMAPRPVIIADGHHRYETAWEYARRHPGATDKLMAFCPLEAPGLTILPNHRLVHGVAGFSLEALVRAAEPWFEVRPLPEPRAFAPTPGAIGVVGTRDARVFRLRDGAAARIGWPEGTSRAWRALAVSILHEGLLKPHLGITDARLEAGTHVEYTADRDEAVRLVSEGRYQAAFLIAPTSPAELLAVVEGSELMPQKSTHFYPKLLDGLVFHRLDRPATADREEARG